MFQGWSRWEFTYLYANSAYKMYIDMVVFIGDVDMMAQILITLSEYS